MRRVAVLAMPLALIACGKLREETMVDPRTGVAVTCSSGRFNVFTPASAQQQVAACADELSHYGFYDEAQLRAAHEPPPAPPPSPTRAMRAPAIPYGTPIFPLNGVGPGAPGAAQPLPGSGGNANWYAPDGPTPLAPSAGAAPAIN
jgi:hypothetical protein